MGLKGEHRMTLTGVHVLHFESCFFFFTRTGTNNEVTFGFSYNNDCVSSESVITINCAVFTLQLGPASIMTKQALLVWKTIGI